MIKLNHRPSILKSQKSDETKINSEVINDSIYFWNHKLNNGGAFNSVLTLCE